LQPGDIVLFLKQESSISSNYQYGVVDNVEAGRDGKVRKIKLRYRNHNENVDRFTNRSTRSVVVIHRIDETNIMEEVGEVSRMVELLREFNNNNNNISYTTTTTTTTTSATTTST
jgi:3-deoxy-D-manno-octulosonic-acid transferase